MVTRGFFLFVLAFLVLPGEVGAQERHTQEHGGQVFHAFRLEAGGGTSDGRGTVEWDVDGWIGTDEDKLWLKSEGERTEGRTEAAEVWVMYSRAVDSFWDAQIGLRHDFQPTSRASLVLGVMGLAPYFIETEAHLFVAQDGDVSARLHAETELFVTQRLILTPYVQAEAHARDVPELEVGAGLSEASFGVQARYEMAREIAPYLDFRVERRFGETGSIARDAGHDPDALVCTGGLRLMF